MIETDEITVQHRDILEHAQLLSNWIFPVERFKTGPENYFQSDQISQIFESSGTSGQKSQSPFSKQGLGNYKIQILRDFLFQLSLRQKDLPKRGISLIPCFADMNKSSLSYMMSSLAKHIYMDFIAPENLCNFLNIQKISSLDFIFGTSSHFQKFLKSNRVKPLKNSDILLFKTGGSKSLDQNINEKSLDSQLKTFFDIPSEHIISEYSMSELAVQAYGSYSNIYRGYLYKFPEHTRLKIVRSEGSWKERGYGLLAVFDPARIDFPFYIVTQDLVTLFSDKSFILHGRAVGAPLKGCSSQYASTSS